MAMERMWHEWMCQEWGAVRTSRLQERIIEPMSRDGLRQILEPQLQEASHRVVTQAREIDWAACY